MAAGCCSTCAFAWSRARTPGSIRALAGARNLGAPLRRSSMQSGWAAALRVQWAADGASFNVVHTISCGNCFAARPSAPNSQGLSRMHLCLRVRAGRHTRGLVLLASEAAVARPSAPASRNPATNFSPLRFSRFRMDGAGATPQRPGAINENVAAADQDPARSQRGGGFGSCFSASCSVDKLLCAPVGWPTLATSANNRRLHIQLIVQLLLAASMMLNSFIPRPSDRHTHQPITILISFFFLCFPFPWF